MTLFIVHKHKVMSITMIEVKKGADGLARVRRIAGAGHNTIDRQIRRNSNGGHGPRLLNNKIKDRMRREAGAPEGQWLVARHFRGRRHSLSYVIVGLLVSGAKA
jgi:hypothetical protein